MWLYKLHVSHDKETPNKPLHNFLIHFHDSCDDTSLVMFVLTGQCLEVLVLALEHLGSCNEPSWITAQTILPN